MALTFHFRGLRTVAMLGFVLANSSLSCAAESPSAMPAQRLATGQQITPLAVPGSQVQTLNPRLPNYPDFVAGGAVRSQLSPDGKTLAVITAGQNSLRQADGSPDVAASTQFLFLFDVAGANKAKPKLVQVIQQTNAHVGLVFAPNGESLYAAGGVDDRVYAYAKANGIWKAAPAIELGHQRKGLGIRVEPNASGLDVSADGKTLVVANNYNDSISIVDTASGKVRYEHDLRAFFDKNEGADGGVGGSFPFGVVVKGNSVAYVSSERDREIVVVDVSSPEHGRLVKRIALDGNALGMVMNRAQTRLYVAQDNADQVAVIDTSTNAVIAKIDARAPAGMLAISKETGAATFAVRLSPDEKTLYAVNAGANSVAVIALQGAQALTVTGLIPTGYEPHDLSLSSDGRWMYVVNGKSVTGPNPGNLSSSTARLTQTSYAEGNAAAAKAARASNQYQFLLEQASLVSAPLPSAADLDGLTAQVALNNGYSAAPVGKDREVMQFLRNRIKHIIYVIKENRTFDQVLGDLTNGANGDPRLTQFGKAITPNFHRLATQFVTLDNFMDPGDGSMDGWSWALQGRVTNVEAITQQLNYAAVNRGMSYESEGTNRNVPVNFATVAERDAVRGPIGSKRYSEATAALPGGTKNLLTGSANHASADAPFGQQQGTIFRAVLQAGGSVRNYGTLVENTGAITKKIDGRDEPLIDPFQAGVVQVAPLDPALAPLTDLYFRGYDQNYPDLWRFQEWKREFDGYVANGGLPSLSMVRLSHDHMGAFGTALAGVNTPETQQADNDLAVGLMVEAVAQSRYASDTLVFVIEDDVQDGPDHVDSHRATTYMVGPYVKQGAIVSTRYNQVNLLRTIEDILGTEHINLNTAFQRPMADVFDITGTGQWTYKAVASTVLASTQLNLQAGGKPVQMNIGQAVTPKHSADYWAKVTAAFDFSVADNVPVDKFNRVLWAGMMGNKPYPKLRNVSGARKAKRDAD